MFNIVLIEPEIPNNTGAIGRLCVNTDTTLHLIKPLGFDISDKAVRRAGLDYWNKLDLHVYENFEEFMLQHGENSERFFIATTKTDKLYFDAPFQSGDYILFGSETKGIADHIMEQFKQITIPMGKQGRSLNLAISAGILLYDAISKNYQAFKEM